MEPLWHRPTVPSDALPARCHVDVAVVGAGLTGLTTALLLSRAGLRTVVLEGRHVGAGTTGRSTGKLSALQGTKLSQIRQRHGDDVLRAYVEASEEGREWLARYASERGLRVERRDALTYAHRESSRDDVIGELEAGVAAGLDVRLDEGQDLPFPVAAAVRLPGQAQVDTGELLEALALDVQRHGGLVVAGQRVRRLSRSTGGDAALRTDDAVVVAHHVVIATGQPFTRRGGWFARVEPVRSYAAAYAVPGGPEPELPMSISSDPPTRSVRTAHDPGSGEPRLVVGGNGHVVGRVQGTADAVAGLDAWAAQWFPGARRTHAWSAHDQRPADGLPHVGTLSPVWPNVRVATGFDKWGLTTAAAAALALSADLLDGDPPRWADALHAWDLRELRGTKRALRAQAGVAAAMVEGWARALTPPRDTAGGAAPDEGAGFVGRAGGVAVARSRVDGVQRDVCAVCPHAGGIVRWNNAERSWDCPLHGSRFGPDGDVLDGPATVGLRPLR